MLALGGDSNAANGAPDPGRRPTPATSSAGGGDLANTRLADQRADLGDADPGVGHAGATSSTWSASAPRNTLEGTAATGVTGDTSRLSADRPAADTDSNSDRLLGSHARRPQQQQHTPVQHRHRHGDHRRQPDQHLGDAVSGTVTASGGTAPYTYSATGLPSGVTLSTDGTFSGTATPAGTFTVTVTATDSTSGTALTGTGSFTWTINQPGGSDADRGHPGHRHRVAVRRPDA